MRRYSTIFLAVLLVMVLAFSTVASASELDRDKTLVVSGAMWAPPSNWNPLSPTVAPGTGGLVYEFLFTYNPVNNELNPHLAKSGKWVSDNEYLVKLRKGVKWTDGEEFNAEDVTFTYQVAKDNSLSYSPVWDWMKSVKAEDDYTVKFTFSEPHYAEWKSELYNRMIIPEHIWSEVESDKLVTLTNKNPVGTGPYMYKSVGQDRMIWERNDNWWGNDVLGKPSPKYIVDLVNRSNNVIMGMLMKGELDLSNNFIPGVQTVKKSFNLETWYEDEPYMLSWNTANLYMNTTRKPMNDSKFRRALAFAMNKETIVDKVYGGLVQASNSTGLFGEGWMEYYKEDVADEYGFSYNPQVAKALMDKAGYVDKDGDGWRDMPNGDPIELEVIVPSGWTDWMEAIKVIANDAQDIGINLKPSFPDFSVYQNKQQNTTFDMLICNFQTTLSSSPFDYWNGVANSDIHGDVITNGNWGAYDNPELFKKIDKFNMTKEEETKQNLAAEIEKTLLVDMPSIPLWHNGLWAQQSTANWTNWPSEDDPYGVPVSWGNAYQLGMYEVLINLKPAK